MNENTGYSLSDIAAATNGINGNEGSWIWFLLIFVLLGWGGGYGGNRGPAPMPVNVATQTDVQNAINNQTINTGIQQLGLATENNNYEAAQLINAQTNAFMQQNNTNQIQAIQGFNNITSGMTNGFNNVSNQISAQTAQLSNRLDNLGYQMDQCCCQVKQQMLQDRLDDRNRQLLQAQNALDNARQTQNILANLGRFVAWQGSGTATTGVANA